MTGCKVVGVTLLEVERWPSHRFSLCHQHTLPMLVKRVVEGGYMAFLKLCCFGGCKEGWLSIFSCNFGNIDDSRGLCLGRDHTIHVPARSSPSSSSLLKCLFIISRGDFHVFYEELQRKILP